jgi:kynurenine 3-monooxygenase
MKVAIVGAGLTGCLLATYLARRGGVEVVLYERRPDPRESAPERGRSINLALSERGLDALRRVGLADQVMKDALPMRGRMIHPVAGDLDFQPYSHAGDRAINSISRGALNNALLDAALSHPRVTVHFGQRVTSLDRLGDADVVFGADGAGSAVRGLLLGEGLLDERLDFLDYGFKELTIPARGGDFALDPTALHIWPRGSSMMIALPNPDRSFTCTLFWPNGGTSSFASLSSPAAILLHFQRVYPDVPPLAPDLVSDYQHNPVGLLGTVHCQPWVSPDGRVALIGDAAHAIVPFYGQGANAAFEDVVELDRCLDETGGDWRRALAGYEQRRRENAEAIARMALENFVEMRDKVASPAFRMRKKLEHVLEGAFPGRYVSRYELVSFSTTPYAEVQRRVRRQQRIVGAVAGGAALLAAGAITALVRKVSR